MTHWHYQTQVTNTSTTTDYITNVADDALPYNMASTTLIANDVIVILCIVYECCVRREAAVAASSGERYVTAVCSVYKLRHFEAQKGFWRFGRSENLSKPIWTRKALHVMQGT